MAAELMIPVSYGELVDKITILKHKAIRITDPPKLQHVKTELDLLQQIESRAQLQLHTDILFSLSQFTSRLYAINVRLWDIEDRLRELEAAADFGGEFVQAARQVYKLNDRRAAIKLAINRLVGSQLVEVKSYYK